MALITMNFRSRCLGMQTEVYVLSPEKHEGDDRWKRNLGKDGKYKCLYLLHGHSDDHTTWLRDTSIEKYAEEYGIFVVMPDGGRSFYCNTSYGFDYYDYITKELREVITDTFNVSDAREDSYISGLSMGGYGALKAAMRSPGRYAMAAGLSPSTDVKDEPMLSTGQLVFGKGSTIPDEEDLFYLAENYPLSAEKPRLLHITGESDFMIDQNRRFAGFMKSTDFDYTYREFPGAHEWGFWDEHIQDVLKWMFE